MKAIVSLLLFFPIQTFSLSVSPRDVRYAFFIVSQPAGYTLPDNGQLRLSDSVVGEYSVVSHSGSLFLCRVSKGSIKALPSCLVELLPPKPIAPPPADHQISNKPLSATSSGPQLSPPVSATIQNPPLSVSPHPKLKLLGIDFTSVDNSHFVLSAPFKYSKFGSVDAIRAYLVELSNASSGTYSFVLPEDKFVSSHNSIFSPFFDHDVFIICIVGGRIGYFYFENGSPVFKPVSVSTLNSLASKFSVLVVAIRNQEGNS
jgi:hypothetical protein